MLRWAEELIVVFAQIRHGLLFDEQGDHKPNEKRREDEKGKPDDIVTLVAADTVAYQDVMDRENNPIKYAREKASLNIKKLAELLGAPYRTV